MGFLPNARLIVAVVTCALLAGCANRATVEKATGPDERIDNWQIPAYFGLTVRDTRVAGNAVYVSGVEPRSPADYGGFQPGDRIRQIGDKSVYGREDMRTILAGVVPGQSVRVLITRPKNQIKVLTVEPGVRRLP